MVMHWFLAILLLATHALQCSSFSSQSLPALRAANSHRSSSNGNSAASRTSIRLVNSIKLSYIVGLRGGGTSTALHVLSPVARDTVVSAMVITESLIWLKIWTTLAARDVLDSKLSRKIIHSGSAPLFMAHWPLYSATPLGRLFAAGVPLLQVIRLYLAGTQGGSSSSDRNSEEERINELVKAVSRTGNKAEALGGPLIYSIVLMLSTIFFFRDSPVGIIAISQMAAGDGVADIFGRKFGTVKWPFSKTKSIVGSTAFVVAGFLVSCMLLALMNFTGVQSFNVMEQWPIILFISVASAIVELFPILDDNITVPAVACVLSLVLLR